MTREAPDEQLEAWWFIERTRPRYRHDVGPGMDGWHHVLNVLLTWDAASASVFRRLYALARNPDERCSLVGWFLLEQHWAGDEEFVRWLRDAAREDPELGAALRFYEIYPKVTDLRTLRLLGDADGVSRWTAAPALTRRRSTASPRPRVMTTRSPGGSMTPSAPSRGPSGARGTRRCPDTSGWATCEQRWPLFTPSEDPLLTTP